MKRRILALVMALVLCSSMSLPAFAASNSSYGNTSGGTSGAGGVTTGATLTVNINTATAKTWAGTSDGITLNTAVIYYYTNSSGQTLATSGSGAGTAYAGNANMSGTRATSQHSVNGGTRWGSWSCGLSASAF